ncbi:hypothetical protein C2845_PM12G19510 [Panicum miliaceum]|uniref:Uncharacterized protein n=1 Tax=Panicum miliaceum TaxID=4540 RepID=A0A3L6QCB9_PANMI|nr:hypothetical protein C2845_PM12G19510 [Panicum miliaceum]
MASRRGGTGADDHDPAPEPQPAAAAVRRGAPLHPPAFQLMLLGAVVIIGAAAAPLPLPRLLAAFVAWLVGYLSLFIPPL